MSKGIFSASSNFCPKCGVKSLTRDTYRTDNGDKSGKVEFLCNACGFGFAINPSLRYNHASNLFKYHRALREPKNSPETD